MFILAEARAGSSGKEILGLDQLGSQKDEAEAEPAGLGDPEAVRSKNP